MSQARNLSGFLAKVLASGDLTDSGVDAVKLGGKDSSYYLDYNNLANAPATGADSAAVINLIDSAYVQARQSSSSSSTFDLEASNRANYGWHADLSSATNTGTHIFGFNGQTTFNGIFWSTDGSYLFEVDGVNDYVRRISVPTPFDISSVTTPYDTSNQIDTTSENAYTEDLWFSPDGLRLVILGSSGTTDHAVHSYTLTSPWDLTTATYDSKTINVNSTGGGGVAGIHLSPDGRKMFIASNSTDKVHEYTLSTAYDVSTATETRTLDISSQTGTASGIRFNHQGTQMFISDSSNGVIVYQYKLTLPFNVSSASYVTSHTGSSGSGAGKGLAFSPDGAYLHTVGNGRVYEITLTGNVSYATPVVSKDVLAYDSNLQEFVDAFTLPTSDGSANQVLVTNGSGTISFVEQSAGLDSAAVSAIITSDVDATFINALTIDADTLGSNAGSYYLDYSNFTNTPTLPVLGTDFVDSTEARGLLSVTDLGGDGSLAYNSSNGILTYTGPSAAEVRAHFSAGTGVTVSSGQISIGQSVGTTDNVTFNDMIVSGDLTVSGTTTTVNSNTVHIGDNIISLNHDETGTPSQDAGIEIERGTSTNKTLVWNETTDKWTVGSETFVAGMFEGSVAATTLTADSATLGAVEGFSHLKAPHSATTKTYTVTVATKTSAHRYNGTGSSNGFVIDGMEAPFLTLTPGRTYRFDQADATNSGHPFRFYYDVAKNDSYTTDITTAGTAGSSGAYTEITVTDTTPLVLHYQCSAHGNMGNAVQTNARNLTGFTTDDLAEGTTNLYGGGGGGTDSAATISLIQGTVDSAYISSKIVSGSTITTTNSTIVRYARLELTANQSISSQTSTVLNFNTRSVDNSTANLLTSTLGSGKFIIPAGVTKVRLKASAQGSNVSDQFILKIMKNGSNAVTTNFDIASTGSDHAAVFTGIESVVEGDYFQVEGYSQISRTVNTSVYTWVELEVLEGSILDETTNIAVNLSALNDVDSSSPSDGQALVWDSANSYWKPGTVSGGGGSALTIQDEGSSLSTAATTLNFTGSAVTASGTGTTKTINITGGGSVNVAASYVEDYSTTIYTATAGLTTFNASSSPALPAYTAGKIGVFVNGVKRTDFTATDGTSVVMTNALALNDHVEIINFGGPLRSAQDVLTETKFTATAGQTTFALNYTAGHITVFLNGAKLSADDYTATNGTSVVLTTGAALNDVVEVIEHGVAFATPYSATNYTKGVSGNVSGNTVSSLTYTPGKEAVYLNGIKLLSGDDYTTVDSGSSITFINNIVDSDRIEVVDHGIVTEATLGLDSAATINLIDSDYVAARAGSGGSGGVTTGKAIAMAIVFGG